MKNHCKILSVGVTMIALQACGDPPPDESSCGPCGSFETGHSSISGNPQIDGFFAATHRFQAVTTQITGDFEADIQALAEVWEYGEAGAPIDAAFVQGLVAHIEAGIEAGIDPDVGLHVVIVPAKCHASVDVAIAAQATCEAEAGCEIDVASDPASVMCEGTCSGACAGTCSGALSCAVETPTVACEGECEGVCDLDVADTCEGTCRGTCVGICSATDANDQCAGTCVGDCMGICELSARSTCGGTCYGTCYVEQGSAQCTGEVECSGSCDASCTGSCEGNFEPPSASSDCEASADCQAQARAQANATLECTPPQLDITFAFSAALEADPEGKAEFTLEMAELEARGAAILHGTAKLSTFVTGELDGVVVFDPSPLAAITAQLSDVITAALADDLDIPEDRLPCVIPAVQDAIEVLSRVGTELSVVIEAQAEFDAIFKP